MDNFTGIILSAGLSSRMGKFKPLMEINGSSFIANIIKKMSSICSNIIIVVGHNHDLLTEHLNSIMVNINTELKIVKNGRYELGMFSSIKAGVQNIKGSEWTLLHSVDQPNLPEQFYFEFYDQIDATYDWIQPTYKNVKGHPIAFNNNVFKLISNSNDQSNLRKITKENRLKQKLWNCNYESVLEDINNITEYNKLLKGK